MNTLKHQQTDAMCRRVGQADYTFTENLHQAVVAKHGFRILNAGLFCLGKQAAQWRSG